MAMWNEMRVWSLSTLSRLFAHDARTAAISRRVLHQYGQVDGGGAPRVLYFLPQTSNVVGGDTGTVIVT